MNHNYDYIEEECSTCGGLIPVAWTDQIATTDCPGYRLNYKELRAIQDEELDFNDEKGGWIRLINKYSKLPQTVCIKEGTVINITDGPHRGHWVSTKEGWEPQK